jgi:hypothetical protein
MSNLIRLVYIEIWKLKKTNKCIFREYKEFIILFIQQSIFKSPNQVLCNNKIMTKTVNFSYLINSIRFICAWVD